MKIKHTTRRLLSMFLAFTMVLSMIPSVAFAEDAELGDAAVVESTAPAAGENTGSEAAGGGDEGGTPEGDDTAPEGDDAAPEGDDAAPEGNDAAPEGDDAAPEGDDAAPEGNDTAPEGDDTTNGGDTTPEGEGTDTEGDDATTEGDGAEDKGPVMMSPAPSTEGENTITAEDIEKAMQQIAEDEDVISGVIDSEAELVDAISNGGTVAIGGDIELTDTLTIPADVEVTLDLAGYTISQEKECTASYEMINNKGTLTITGDGTISLKDTGAGDPNFGWGSYTIRNEGTLTVESGTIEFEGAQAFGTHCSLAIFQYSGSTTINDGNIINNSYRSVRLWKGDMTINGGTFNGQVWVHCVDDSAKLTITGGSFAPAENGGDGSSVFVNNSGKKAKLSVSGGTFATKIGANDTDALAGAITGGTFTAAAVENTNDALLASGFKFTKLADGTYGVVNGGTWGGIDWKFDESTGTMTIAPTKGTPEIDPKTGKPYPVGYWRENVIYNKNGEATAKGGRPYEALATKVKTLIIEEGVNHIGAWAANGFTGLTCEIVIPWTVNYIGQEALQKCTFTKLTFEKVPEGKTGEELCIAQGALKNLIVEKIELPDDRPVHIHVWQFLNSAKLKHITFPATLTSVTGGHHHDWMTNPDATNGAGASSSTILNSTNEALETITFANEAIRNLIIAKDNAYIKNFGEARIGLTYCKDVQVAVNVAEADDIVLLIKNVTAAKPIEIAKAVILDLNGKTFTGTFKLAEGATLTAPEGLDVVSGVEGYKAVYENGTYKLEEIHYVAQVGETKYKTLAEAIAAAQAGDTVKVLADIALTDGITVAADKNITLDLNGKTVSQTKEQTAGYQMILNDGALTIDDSVGGGKLSYTDSGKGGEYISDTIYNCGTLVINGGTIENISSAEVASNGYPHAVDNYSGIRDTSVTINGGTVYCAEYSAIRMFCVSAEKKADLIINYGATIKGAIDMQNGTKNAALGTLTVNGGTFETTKNANNIRFANWNGGATEYGITAAISGGSFNGGLSSAYVPAAANWNQKIITGGTYANDPTAFVADGYAVVENTDGTYGVVKGLKGSGTAEDPFQISNLAELTFFRDSVNAGETTYNADGKYVALVADIDMIGADWSVNIGDDCSYTFDGIFDGKDHTISNLTSTETAQKDDDYICTGLFGAIAGNAVIKNLTLDTVTIDTGAFTGNNAAAVVGFVYQGACTIENVKVTNATINAAKVDGTGAIVGYDYYSGLKISNCSVENSEITGQAYVGGIIGYASSGATVSASSVTNSDVIATACAAGGVAGILLAGGEVSGATVKSVDVSAAHENWQNSAAIAVGTTTGTITVSMAGYENVTANRAATDVIVGSEHKNKPTTPVAKVQARIGDVYYLTFDNALAAVQAGGTITLLDPVVITADTELDLKDITIVGDIYPAFRVQNGATLTVANGNITNGDYVFTLGSSDKAEAGNLVIKSGKYVGEITVANVVNGSLIIENGDFEVTGDYGATYLLNCIDDMYKAGKATITVKGGSFKGFNPADNAAEGEDTNFVADGYESTSADGTTWTVAEKQVVESPIKLVGRSLLYRDIIQNKYYFNFDAVETDVDIATNSGVLVWNEDEYAAATEFTYAAAPLKIEGLTAAGKVNNVPNSYSVETAGIPAKNMGESQFVIAYLKLADGSYVYSDPVEFSPLIYANAILSRESSSKEDKNLVIALMNYGAAAQKRFNYKTDNLMNSGFTAEQQEIGFDESMLKAVPNDDAGKFSFTVSAQITKYGSSLTYVGAIEHSFYSNVQAAISNGAKEMGMMYWTDATYNSVDTLTADNADGIVDLTHNSGIIYKAKVPGTPAKDLERAFFTCAYVVDANGTYHYGPLVIDSAHHYASRLLASSAISAEEKDLARAMIVYNLRAAERLKQ